MAQIQYVTRSRNNSRSVLVATYKWIMEIFVLQSGCSILCMF